MDDNNKMTREEKIQIAGLIIIVIVIFVMIVTVITLVRYAEEIKSSPIDYAIKNQGIESCVCYNDKGEMSRFGREDGVMYDDNG